MNERMFYVFNLEALIFLSFCWQSSLNKFFPLSSHLLTIIPSSSIDCAYDKHQWIMSLGDLIVIIYIFIKKKKKIQTNFFYLLYFIQINFEMWQMSITHLYSQHDPLSICGDIFFLLPRHHHGWCLRNVVRRRKKIN